MNFLTNLFGNHVGNMLTNHSDPWAGMRTVGNTVPTFNKGAHNVFGSLSALGNEQQTPQFSPVQMGGQNSGNDLSQLVLAMLKNGGAR